MKADPTDQLRLLDLQALDAAVDRLAVRRRTLPELATIGEAEGKLTVLRDELVTARTESSDIGREQTKLETDVEQVRSRSERDQARLLSGAVTASKELESLQHEVESLARRQDVLETELLEVMERRESADAVVRELQGRVAEIEAARDSAAISRDAAFAEIDAETERLAAERGPLAASLPSELVALYDKVRAAMAGGVAAAPLQRKRCEGCHLELSGTDLTAVRAAAPDDVLRCEECRRILVRTAESGL